jgi:transcription initiation factor IIE alpha subunit
VAHPQVADGNINRACDAVRENIRILAEDSNCHCESMHHKPWFDEEYSKFVD